MIKGHFWILEGIGCRVKNDHLLIFTYQNGIVERIMIGIFISAAIPFELTIFCLIKVNIMRWIVVCFLFVMIIEESWSAANRTGPCPGIPLNSCECFQQMYDTYVEIANMTDIVARNWRISLWYEDMSHAFQKLLHTAPDSTPGLPSVGVWPAVAAWASNNVGFSIRKQPLPELWSFIIRDLPQWMQDILDRMSFGMIDLLFKEILDHASVALGGGNLFVFNEIGYSYAHYGMNFCTDTSKPDDSKMTEFIQKYICADGQCDLAKGLWALFKAHFGSDEGLTFSERDQLLLVQGMYVGLAEQTHLQPFINASLPGYTTNWCRFWLGTNLTECHELIDILVSRILVHMLIGSHRLLTNHDIPSGVHNGSNFSPYLTNLTLPEAHDLMLEMLNSTTLSLNHTSATNWNILAERMRFVAPLFWVFQDHEELNCHLFSVEQEHLIRTDQTDKLDPHSWTQICDKDCCASNGHWNGEDD